MHEYMVALFTILLYCKMTGTVQVGILPLMAPLMIDICLSYIEAKKSEKIFIECIEEYRKDKEEEEHAKNDNA